jgi:hypothetical protein
MDAVGIFSSEKLIINNLKRSLQLLIGDGWTQIWHLTIHRHLIEPLVQNNLLGVGISNGELGDLVHEEGEITVACITRLVGRTVNGLEGYDEEERWVQLGGTHLILEAEEGVPSC